MHENVNEYVVFVFKMFKFEWRNKTGFSRYATAQLPDALNYKPEYGEYESQCCLESFSSCTVLLGSTRPLTEMTTWDIS